MKEKGIGLKNSKGNTRKTNTKKDSIYMKKEKRERNEQAKEIKEGPKGRGDPRLLASVQRLVPRKSPPTHYGLSRQPAIVNTRSHGNCNVFLLILILRWKRKKNRYIPFLFLIFR